MMDPVPSGPDSDRSAEAPSNPSDKDVAHMAQEGGVNLIHFLLAKAGSPTDTTEILPSPNSVREWQFHDILKFPKEIQEEWKAACQRSLHCPTHSDRTLRSVLLITQILIGFFSLGSNWNPSN